MTIALAFRRDPVFAADLAANDRRRRGIRAGA